MYARLLMAWLGLAGFLCLGVVEAADKPSKETTSGPKSLKEDSGSSSSSTAKKPTKIGDAGTPKKMGKRELQQQKFKEWLLKTYDKNKNGKMDENERQVRLRDLRNQREKQTAMEQAAAMRSMGGRMGRMHHRRW
jgi:hypothetical protein